MTTSRRGRAEIRLADGNIIALDRSTTVRFQSILDSYDGDNAQTVVELRTGHVAIERDDDTRQILRLDTPPEVNAEGRPVLTFLRVNW